MANFIQALVSAELSLFGVAPVSEPASASPAPNADTAPRFDSEHYRSALG
ncbi:hypothetical protein [Achromobacter deleyi]|nr:hypothetical protein [Achromobacter deleyi]QVQ26524.1 hypothetical protein HLG70_27435 [Achromobacter deleyi]UIP22096.1 hypothetical protein LYZ39_06110 [Achromobacter deleyi]